MNGAIAATGKFRVGMNGNNGTLRIRNAAGIVQIELEQRAREGCGLRRNLQSLALSFAARATFPHFTISCSM